MAFQFIRSFWTNTESGGTISTFYNPATGDFNIIWNGTGGTPTLVTESELGYSNNEQITETLCYEGDKHIFFALLAAPFLRAEVEADSPDCVVTTTPTPPVDPPDPGLTLNYIAYQVKFKNFEEQIVEANIFDQDTYEEGREIEYRQLRPAGDPITIEVIDNDEDKFTPIRAKQCIIRFLSSNQYDLNLFSDGQDNRWYVELKVNSAIKFKGFLVLDDLEEDFLSPPNVVTLTATDNLGSLKDIALTNFDGVSPIVVRPKVLYRWLDYLGWALSKTSLSLPINIIHNLREAHSLYEPFWTKIYLEPKSFEDEIGTCIDCYEVIERLLGKECFITQHNGEWWVQRVDELERTRYVWNVNPALTNWILTETEYNKTIKKTLDIKWIERSAYVKPTRPHKFIKEEYQFVYPKEIIDNIDFTRGDQILVEVLPAGQRHYHLLDWTFGRYPGASAASAYIRRLFIEDLETERFVVITKSANSGSGLGVHYVASSRVPMLEKDKFTFSVDRRLELNMSGSGFLRTAIAQIRFYANDGTYYVLAGTTHTGTATTYPVWRTTDITFTTNADYIWQETDLSIDDRTWATISEDAPPVPKDGEVQILLLQTANIPTTSETHFANLQFSYSPYLKGTYQKYSGQYWKVSQDGEYKAKREDEVYVTDSPRQLFKGAMLYFDYPEGRYHLTTGWYDYSLSPSTPQDELVSYGWFQAQAVWNQYNRVMRIFDGEMLGLTDDDLPDLIHKFTMGEDSPHSRLRDFMCLHYSMSLKTCRWTAYFVEIFKSDVGKVYDDTTEFKFIESR